MKSKLLLLSSLLAVCGCSQEPAAETKPAAAAPYKVIESLAGPEGSYDYASVDSDARQLFVGREDGVMRINLKDGKSSTLLKRDGVAAVLPIAGTRLMLSTNGGSNTATLFDRDTGTVVSDFATGKEPDGAYYDADSGIAFVMNGESQDVTLIDVKARKVVATISVPGVPEAAVSDGKGKLFVNIEDTNEIAIIDIAAKKLAGTYALPGCNEPTGIAYDSKTGLLISACHNGTAKLIDAASGADKGQVAIGQGADGVLFDPVHRIGYASCIDGTLTIFSLDDAGKPTPLQTLTTRVGARTLAYDAATDRIYLPAATVERDDKGEYIRAKKDFAVVVVGR